MSLSKSDTSFSEPGIPFSDTGLSNGIMRFAPRSQNIGTRRWYKGVQGGTRQGPIMMSICKIVCYGGYFGSRFRKVIMIVGIIHQGVFLTSKCRRNGFCRASHDRLLRIIDLQMKSADPDIANI